MANWGSSTVSLGSLPEWRACVRHVKFEKEVSKVCLWMDSTDFPKQKYRGCSTKEEDWSYKLNRPGRRYLVLRDGHGRIRKVWGGYSSKIYDGSLLELNREWFKENLANAGVIADQHFEWGKKKLQEG
jgi:hypothetical protein